MDEVKDIFLISDEAREAFKKFSSSTNELIRLMNVFYRQTFIDGFYHTLTLSALFICIYLTEIILFIIIRACI